MSDFTYLIDKQAITRTVNTEPAQGEARTQLSEDTNLLEDSSFDSTGFTVSPLLTTVEFEKLQSAVFTQLSTRFGAGLNELNISAYLQGLSDERFHQAMRSIYLGFRSDELGLSQVYIEESVSELLNRPITLRGFPEQKIFIRIIRPNRPDYNPPHRDTYIDRLRNAANAYLPIFGSNEQSSLPILPGSHHWSDENICLTPLNPTVDGVEYTVPAVTSLSNGETLQLNRPLVDEGSWMVFSPYLIHGGAANTTEQVRISLEFRFEAAQSQPFLGSFEYTHTEHWR